MACEEVLKLKLPVSESKLIKSEDNYINGMYVSQPKKRDNVERPAVEVDRSLKVKKQTIKEIFSIVINKNEQD